MRLLGVGAGLSVWNLCKGEPGAPLEFRPDEIERELELPPAPGEILGELLPRLIHERAWPDRLAVTPLEPLQAALGGNDPQSLRPAQIAGAQRSAPSSRNSCTFRSSPPAYPVRLPFAPTTRWHASTIGTGFRFMTVPTARAAPRLPASSASEP
ncbi:MAG: hypothetical protein JWM06_2531 [Actinomycetia bacterium]|nr:hypothetical protein [Actinomycetes bacterium]